MVRLQAMAWVLLASSFIGRVLGIDYMSNVLLGGWMLCLILDIAIVQMRERQ